MRLAHVVSAAFLLALAPALVAQSGPGAPLRAVPFERVDIDDAFWSPRLEIHRKVTVAACLDKCEQTGRIANFARAAGLAEGGHEGLLFDDSDVYKTLEGVAYTLHVHPDEALEARADAIIAQIAAAQEDDGYLNTYVQLVDPQLRWKQLQHSHELYCAGHLIEAGIAYWRATQKRALLDVGVRLADRIDADFGPGKLLDPDGHQEIELALLELSRVVDPEAAARYVALARFFVEQRGSSAGRQTWGEYCQDHAPVREQSRVVGHAVRAMYQYCAMADLAALVPDASLMAALERIWTDLVESQMYVTGGIGSTAGNEGFGAPFDLPNDTAYAETCASIGMVLWNQRMFQATRDVKYVEVLERALYNGVLAGMDRSGERFFYDNPLGSRGDHRRVPWFDCSCCPSNLVRFLPALGGRIYALGDGELWVTLLVGSATTVEIDGVPVRVRLETALPWKGDVVLRVDPAQPVEFDLRLRMPAWTRGGWKLLQRGAQPLERPVSTISLDGEQFKGEWLSSRRRWEPGDVLALRLDLEPQVVHPDPRVKANSGRVALQRGPLVYCFEEADNFNPRSRAITPEKIEALWDPELLGGIVKLRARGPLVIGRAGTTKLSKDGTLLTAIPYALWANREAGDMVVWVPTDVAQAEVPGEEHALERDGLLISASHCWRGDSLAALVDAVEPASSSDPDVPRMTFWDHRGTTEWIEYRFAAPKRLAQAQVYWFDDTGRGNCRVPASWHLAVERPEGWERIEGAPGAANGVQADRFNDFAFAPVETAAVRLVVELQEGFSAGVLEWRVGE
jgi:uncharacterized protein